MWHLSPLSPFLPFLIITWFPSPTLSSKLISYLFYDSAFSASPPNSLLSFASLIPSSLSQSFPIKFLNCWPNLSHLCSFLLQPAIPKFAVSPGLIVCSSLCYPPTLLGFPCGSAGKESACNVGDLGSIPGLGRSPGEGKGYPLQYSGLENSMDCIVHWVTKSRTRLSNFHFTLPPFDLVPSKSSPAIAPTPSGVSSTPKIWHQGISDFWGLMKVIATFKKGFVGEILV